MIQKQDLQAAPGNLRGTQYKREVFGKLMIRDSGRNEAKDSLWDVIKHGSNPSGLQLNFLLERSRQAMGRSESRSKEPGYDLTVVEKKTSHAKRS
jgi:hypothetical protein